MGSNSHKRRRKKLFLDLIQKNDPSLEGFETRKAGLSPTEIEHETELLWARIRPERNETPLSSRFLKRRQFFYSVAASLALFITAIAVFFLLNENSSVSLQTTYGETQFITLPDSSTVLLNANSQLAYPENWDQQAVREVWLEGEAFFHVEDKSNQGGIKFIVHTKGVDVEVLGTRFNVRSRRSATEVVLNSGKVKLNFEGKEAIYMEPGDRVAYSVKTQRYDRRQVNPETYTSWRNNVLTFDESTLGEIAAVLEDTYGLRLTFKDPEIAEKRFTTTLPADQIEILYPMLEESFNLKIKQNGKQITIAHAP